MTSSKKMGRPAKSERPDRITLDLDQALAQRVREAAEKSDRSLRAEIEKRLRESFEQEKNLI